VTSVLEVPVLAPPCPVRDLLAVLDDALALCAEHDDADLRGITTAGRAVLGLAALARRAAAALGADPGTLLAGGQGVVVVRDLDAATRLLARAAGARTVPSSAGAEQLLDRLRRGLTAAA
jgi:hypothetical protein